MLRSPLIYFEKFMEISIYHNPRCSKSRQTLEIVQKHLEPSDFELRVIEYLKTPPTHQQLDSILRGLEMQPRDLIRTGEAEYLENSLDDKSLSRDQLIAVMISNPKLIERPIVIAGNQIAIGRPPEAVIAILP
ncbi:MAG: arsenate reductase [Arenicella sp.]|jgi:arsenate reductase